MDTERKRVLVVEDHEVVGEGLRALLLPRYDVVGPVRDGHEVLAAVDELHPDVVLLDLTLPGRSGLDLLPDLHKNHPRLPVVILTATADYLTGQTSKRLGAAGFLPKDSGSEELHLAIQAVMHGKTYLSPRVTPPPHGVHVGPLPSSISQLTPRQLEILRRIGEGHDTGSIAEQLGVSEHTVHFHRRNLRRLLGIESEQGLTRVATMFTVREELGPDGA
jgi:DNA-binding NarL/FixJ family response regulator